MGSATTNQVNLVLPNPRTCSAAGRILGPENSRFSSCTIEQTGELITPKILIVGAPQQRFHFLAGEAAGLAQRTHSRTHSDRLSRRAVAQDRHAIGNAQERAQTFIEPQAQVYEGMIVGLNSRPEDMAFNIVKEKKQTNIRSSTSDIAVKLRRSA